MSIMPMSSNMAVHLYEDASVEVSIDEHSRKAVFIFSDRGPTRAITKVLFFVDAPTLAKLAGVVDLAERSLQQVLQRQKAVEYVRTDDRFRVYADPVADQQVAARAA